MPCPVCKQNVTNPNHTYCSASCAELLLAAVRESYKPRERAVIQQRTEYVPKQHNPLGFMKPSYQQNVPSDTNQIIKPSYQELLKQNQEKIASLTVSNKCKNEKCPEQTTDNNLYCDKCSDTDPKCKKCGTNDRNMTHPIFTSCHKDMKEKPKEKKVIKNDKKEKKVSKYDKNKKPKEMVV
jgi:hypothetical protein